MKASTDDLAVFGGPPEFEEPLHVGRPHIVDRDAVIARVDDMLARRWLTNNGPFVEELERRIAEFVGVEHCVATANGTSALQIAALAAGMSGEVIVPAFTFVATAHALSWVGLTPVLCDIDPITHNLDPESAERLVGERTSGIVPVHLWGRAADVEAIAALCERQGLSLVFDAAHAFACSHAGRMVGSFGTAEVFSLHATKLLNAMEGGAIVTANAELAERARLMRNFGFAGYDQVVSLGINAKMPEMAAAMGLTSFEHLDALIDLNRENAEAYADGLRDLPGIAMLAPPPGERHNYQHLVLEIDPERSPIARDELHRVLWAENVLARRYFYPGVHRMEPYATRTGGDGFPVTDIVATRTLVLPSGGELDPETASRVSALVRFACEHAAEIAAR